MCSYFFDAKKNKTNQEMKRCCLTATEHMCVPTQWFVVDATGNHRYVDLLKHTKGPNRNPTFAQFEFACLPPEVSRI
jgi:hypothetical protein